MPFQAMAEDTNLAVNEVNSGTVEKDVFSYNLTNGVMTWTFHQDNSSLTIENGICVVDGNPLSFDISAKLFDKNSEGNEATDFLAEWMNNTTIEQIIFSDNVRQLDTQLFSTWFFRDSYQILMGNQMEYIGHDAFNSYVQIETLTLPTSLQQIGENAFNNCENLTDVTVLSNDVILDNSGIGYNCGKPLDNMIIRGYRNSPAETYANKNGFTFIALDKQPTTTTTTELTTTTTTTTKTPTTTVTIDESKTNSTTDATITTDSSTTEETTTTTTEPTTTTTVTTQKTLETNTEQTTEPPTTGIGDSVTTETSTVPPTTTTGTETTLPQTGYSKWYHVAAVLAVCMIGIGSAMIISSGTLKKKRR